MKHKLVVYVPISHTDAVRNAMGKVGAGKLGNYTFCSFSIRGVGRSLPVDGANPFIGTVGKLEEIEEERVEVTVDETVLDDVISAMKSVHPYDEIAYDIYKLENK